jgi:DNA-binding NarL/FixJ family response regulator
LAGGKLTLSVRQKQVLQMIADGKQSKQIARELDLKFHTVEEYRQNVIVKLNARNSAHAVAIAVRNQLI